MQHKIGQVGKLELFYDDAQKRFVAKVGEETIGSGMTQDSIVDFANKYIKSEKSTKFPIRVIYRTGGELVTGRLTSGIDLRPRNIEAWFTPDTGTGRRKLNFGWANTYVENDWNLAIKASVEEVQRELKGLNKELDRLHNGLIEEVTAEMMFGEGK